MCAASVAIASLLPNPACVARSQCESHAAHQLCSVPSPQQPARLQEQMVAAVIQFKATIPAGAMHFTCHRPAIPHLLGLCACFQGSQPLARSARGGEGLVVLLLSRLLSSRQANLASLMPAWSCFQWWVSTKISSHLTLPVQQQWGICPHSPPGDPTAGLHSSRTTHKTQYGVPGCIHQVCEASAICACLLYVQKCTR